MKKSQIKIGDQFEAKVEDLSSSGMGILRYKGLTVFGRGVWLGETAIFKITELKKRFAIARLIEITETAIERRNSVPCEYHGVDAHSCGGCPWMFVDYGAQLKAKQSRVESHLTRIEPSWVDRLRPIVASDKSTEYRNRVQLKSNGSKLGFLSEQSHQLIDVKQCPVLVPKVQGILGELRSQLPNKTWMPKKRHKWVTLDADTDSSVDTVSVNKRLPFRQANDEQNLRMQTWLGDKLAQIQSTSGTLDRVVELFCGAGNFTKVIAKYCRSVWAAECNAAAIDSLKERVGNDDMFKHIDPHLVDLFDKDAFSAFIKRARPAQVLVLDPPRDGLKIHEGLFEKKKRFSHILYVSCDLATFTRDAHLFNAHGYSLVELQPIDLFPQTPHIELMAWFSL